MQPPASPFKALKLLHTALLAMFGSFVLISFLLVKRGITGQDEHDMDMIFQVIAAVLSIGALLGGFSMFKKRLVEIRKSQESAESKFAMYRGACIMWWAMLEGPGLFAAISYMVVGNVAFLALALFHFIVLVVFMPRKDNIIMLLNLTSDDVRRLENNPA
jgi:hypothetical protein